MKRSLWIRVLAMLLVVSMLPVPVSAATWASRSNTNGWGSFLGNLLIGFWDSFWGGFEEKNPEPETELVLEEDASTVDNGELLRASTYALTTVGDGGANSVNAYSVNATADGEESTTKVTYFPVTMFNYDQATINAATDRLDDDLTVREGFYFSNGGTEVPSNVTTPTTMAPGQYYIQNIRAYENGVDCWLQAHESNKIHGVAQAHATIWTLEVEDGQYYLKTQIDGEDYYMLVGTNGNNDGYTTTKTPIEIVAYSGNAEGVQLRQNGYYLCQWGSKTAVDFGGYNVNNDGGNGMRFYAVTDGGVSDTPTTLTLGESYVSSGYEAWNRWAYNSNGHTSQNKAYTGLVRNELINDQIVFNVNEPGVFDDNAEIKDIYTYVGLPFVLDTTTGTYTFCSDDNGVYFADTDSDGYANPQSGTAQAPYNLYFDEGNTQGWGGMNLEFGDKSSNLWAPFNTNENDTGKGTIDYHFGMRADLPFSMTPNGRIKSTDDESTPITFSFQGDDDVWVFIDGHLVIDLGGIHNRLGATIDFAANTITYAIPGSNDSNQALYSAGSHNDPDFQMTQKLFTDSEGTGVINMTRDAFAMIEDHEMEVFYLERGEGTSNAKIEFNLPMNDTLMVTKDATKSWSQAGEEADLEANPNMEDPGVDDLTDSEQAAINNMNFGFTLYQKDLSVEDAEFEPVANTNFYLLDAEGNRISVPSTDANGRFYLKNGQTAKFITDIPATGITYYVVEDAVPDGFVTPDFNFAGQAVYDYSYTDGKVTGTAPAEDASQIPEQIIDLDAASNKSYEVTVKGSIEANDSIEFICSNYMDATLPNPSIFAQEDIIVIDYGLPVQIDPLANDLFRGETLEILYVGGADVTLSTSTDEDGYVTGTYTEDDTLDFGSVELVKGTASAADDSRDSMVYTLDKQLTEVEVLTYIARVTDKAENAAGGEKAQNAYAIGKVYIVPATIMYYEENFSDMVTFTGSNWKGEVTTAGASDYQEPGVVGTVGDSTYGTDVAYLTDSKDSNGTSYYGDTTKGAMKFEYTFTGTGSSFFARTSATTGYMQVKLYSIIDGVEKQISITYRDTYYKDTNNSDLDASGTLYNIPVYYTGELDYGTYKVVVTVAKAGTKAAGGENGSGNEFYLDGIRVFEPLNEDDETIVDDKGTTATEKALGAYATDGEANMETVTLRYKLITDAEEGNADWNFVVLTDTDGEIVTAENYTSIGPKEEVYLNKGQSVSFSLKYWQTDGLMLYMGMKAPFGSANVQVGKSTFALENATDCHYDVTSNYSSLVTKYEQEMDEAGNLLYTDADGKVVYETEEGYWYQDDDTAVGEGVVLTPKDDLSQPYYVATFTFTATDSIVSLTNIKVTGNYEFTIIEDTDITVDGSENA